MTRLEWGAVGERFFEVGVDRGVLYVGDLPGVPWNGLISVDEAATGGEAKAYYLDGVKYQNRATPEEFETTITAYTYPPEFGVCDGTAPVSNGLYATQQKRKPFGMVYRTLVGNDVNGEDHAYKLHLVYGALAAPSARSNASISESTSPFNFSWRVTTQAPRVRGTKPTSHFVIDSRETPASVMADIEDILYGTATSVPRLPSVPELFFVFNSFNATGFDAGIVGDPYFNTLDSGIVGVAQTTTIDGGAA